MNQSGTTAVAEAREALVSKFIFEMGHRAACPAHMDRVRNVGPCDCGAETEANELADAFEAAIRAERERPQDSAPRDLTKPPIVVGIDVEDEEWMNAPLGVPRPAPTEYDTLLRQYRELEARAVERQPEALRAAAREDYGAVLTMLGDYQAACRVAARGSTVEAQVALRLREESLRAINVDALKAALDSTPAPSFTDEDVLIEVVAALGGAVEQIKAHGGEPSENAKRALARGIETARAFTRTAGEGSP